MKKFLKLIGILILLTAAFAAGFVGWYLNAYQNRVYYGVRVAGANGLSLAGKTKEEVVSLIEQFEAQLAKDQIIFQSEDKNTKISPVQIATDPTLSRELVSFPKDQALQTIFGLGRTGTWVQRLQQHLQLLQEDMGVSLPVT